MTDKNIFELSNEHHQLREILFNLLMNYQAFCDYQKETDVDLSQIKEDYFKVIESIESVCFGRFEEIGEDVDAMIHELRTAQEERV